MEVWPRGSTRRAHRRNGVSCSDTLAFFYSQLSTVGIASLKAIAVVDNDQISIASSISRERHNTISNRLNRCSFWSRDVESIVVTMGTIDRIFAVSKDRAYASLNRVHRFSAPSALALTRIDLQTKRNLGGALGNPRLTACQGLRQTKPLSAAEHLIAELLIEELLENLTTAARKHPLRDCFSHFLDHNLEKHCLKLASSVLDLRGSVTLGRACGLLVFQERHVRKHGNRINHRATISACRAPAARMAWRITIKSRGLTPMLFKAATSSPMLTPSIRRS